MTFYAEVFELDFVPMRIISLVPSQTELLYDLGLEDRIVGITKFCVHPHHFKSAKTIVGGTKKVSFHKIKSLTPDLIIANKEENTVEMVMELQKICTVWVTNIISIDDNFKMISDFGKWLGCGKEAAKWNSKIAFAYQDFANFIADKPKLTVAYLIWKNPYMAAGGNTFINEMLTINRFENVYQCEERYPEIELQNIKGDLLLLSTEPFPFTDKDISEISALTNTKTILVEGEMFSWYGSRILNSFRYFKALHHLTAQNS